MVKKGPRIYNGPTEDVKWEKMQKQARRKIKEKHRIRRSWIIAIFSFLIIIGCLNLLHLKSKTNQLNQQISASKMKLDQVDKTNTKLKTQEKNLKETDYLEKWIRYKLYYSKKGEQIYNIPEPQDND
ncbi:septum formation initiator family protein [Lactobacillus sp. PV037]|uniref:FtsB family cell division protein n=1 Tax=Lactobacillus sp. PV037 TaxID=2594496 RepID=UPI00223F94D0|nr:septum formation initiator family protein [Lactobacillus sp. PV037]QNQ84159.1 septum formation initiator family protein [Lactobacillus sp. PV037]